MDLMDLLVKISAKDNASAVINNVARTAQSAASSIQKAFDGIGNTISQEFETVETALTLVGNEAENAARTASSAFDGIGSALSSAFEAAASAAGSIGTAAETAAASSQSAFEGVGAYISAAFDAVATTASNIGTAMEGAAGVSSSSFDWVASEITPQFEAVSEAASDVGDSAEQSASRASSAFQGINLSSIINGISTVASTAGSVMSTVASSIGNSFQSAASVASKAVDGLKTVIGGIGSVASSAASAAKSAFESIGSAVSTVASAVESVASTLGNIGSIVAGGVWSLSSSAVDSYADYEQLVGGVETLFGAGGRTLEEYADWKGLGVDEATEKYNSLLEAQEKVFSDADNAYYTSGMSANDYMDTATFLSASLISSLAGDTVEAADLIETAMVDMSDNANKFGSDLSSITNAYKGFSKRTFTMLDNLKLGYGGTTGEMARLLNDANAIDSSILGEGVTLETSGTHLLDDIGLDQMIKAIHVIQQEMDITGTTSDEAMTTIQGSTNMAKAAWSDMMTAIADENADFEGAVDKVVSSTGTALENLIPRIQQSFVGIGNLIGELAPTIISEVPNLISSALPGLTSALSGIIEAAADALPGIAEAVVSSIPDVAESFGGITETLITAVDGVASAVVNSMTNMFKDFTGIDLSPIVSSLQTALSTIKQTLSSVFSQFNMDTSAVETINDVISELAGTFDHLIDLVTGEAFKGLSGTIFGAFSSIGSSLAEHMQPAVDQIKNLIDSVMSGDSGHIDRIKEAIQKFTGIFTEHIAPIIGTISSAVVSLMGAFLEIGVQVIEGVVAALGGLFGYANDEGKVSRFQYLAQAVGEIFGMFKDALAPIIDAVKEAAINLFNYLFGSEDDITGFKKVMDDVKAVFETVANNITYAWEEIKKLVSVLTDNEATIGDKVKAIGQYFIDNFKQAWQTTKDLVYEVGTALVDAIKEAIRFFKELLGLQEEEEKHGGRSGSFGNSGYESTGENISAGLANGITKSSDAVSKSVEAVLYDAEATAKKVTDSHSPSRKYMKLGGYMIEGLRIGWERGVDGMLREMQQSYAMMERIETPTTYAEVRAVGGTALNRATTDIANALLGVSAATETGAGTPVNLVVDGKTLATVMIEPLQSVLKQKGVTLYA